jgi:hypothetical protein
MTLIEVQSSQEKAQTIMVHEGPDDRDNTAEAARYRQEAENQNLSKWERWSKLDTASVLTELALKDAAKSDLANRIKEYSGEKPPTSR